jgi:CubicO group peptidase (beta-lactamase class C family)
MGSSQFEKKLVKEIEARLAPAAPGIQVQVHEAGRKVCDISVGTSYAYYDLASLTKIIFPVQAMMKAYQEGHWNLKSKVIEFCPWIGDENLLVRDLLSHSAGFIWWLPLFEKIDLGTSRMNRWTETAKIIRSLPLEKTDSSVYSDVGFIMLGHVLESIYSLPLTEIWEKIKSEFYPGTTLDFAVDNQSKKDSKYYVLTERSQWRGKILQGEVHDDNTWALGGVSTHAGLFGSIDDLGWFGLFLRSQLKGISKTAIKQKTAVTFATRARPAGKGDWALGYMMPTKGSSSSGKHFSTASIGHTGFTGTSLWYDPVQDLSIAILSNRVFLGRENKEFALLRPEIHNWIVEGIRRK